MTRCATVKVATVRSGKTNSNSVLIKRAKGSGYQKVRAAQCTEATIKTIKNKWKLKAGHGDFFSNYSWLAVT